MARPGKDEASLVRLPQGLGYLRHAIANDGYNATVREACRALRCSRGFFDAHVRPHVKHVYAAEGWSRLLVRQMPGLELGSTYYNRDELNQIARSAVVERRSRDVWFIEHVPARTRASMLGTLAEVAAKCADEDDDERCLMIAEGACKHLGDLLLATLDDDWRRAHETFRWSRQRSRAHWVALGDLPPRDLEELEAAWTTAAAMKGYGDTDEEVQRDIWRRGMVRAELVLPDGTRRVMYAADPTAEPTPAYIPTDFYARRAADVLHVAVAVEALPASYVAGMVER